MYTNFSDPLTKQAEFNHYGARTPPILTFHWNSPKYMLEILLNTQFLTERNLKHKKHSHYSFFES